METESELRSLAWVLFGEDGCRTDGQFVEKEYSCKSHKICTIWCHFEGLVFLGSPSSMRMMLGSKGSVKLSCSLLVVVHRRRNHFIIEGADCI